MTCREVVEVLWEYIDAELTPERLAEVRAHLELCEPCFTHYDFQKAFLEFVRKHGNEAAPPALRDRILHRLAAEPH